METIIKTLKVENFRALKNASFENFTAFNIITGAPGTGKSTLLDIIKLMSHPMDETTLRQVFLPGRSVHERLTSLLAYPFEDTSMTFTHIQDENESSKYTFTVARSDDSRLLYLDSNLPQCGQHTYIDCTTTYSKEKYFRCKWFRLSDTDRAEISSMDCPRNVLPQFYAAIRNVRFIDPRIDARMMAVECPDNMFRTKDGAKFSEHMMSEQARYYLRLISAIVAASNGVLIVRNFEIRGQTKSDTGELYRTVLNLCAELNVQCFMEVKHQDTIVEVLSNFEDNGRLLDDLSIFTIRRSRKTDRTVVKSWTGPRCKTLWEEHQMNFTI